MTKTCTHLDQIRSVVPAMRGCEECLQVGDDWAHLRGVSPVGMSAAAMAQEISMPRRTFMRPGIRSLNPLSLTKTGSGASLMR